VKAIVYQRYGTPDVLELKDVAKPVPKDHEVLIRVRATTVTSGDARLRALHVPRGFGLISRLVFGVFRPRQGVLGSELAGIVESVGKDVTQFKTGDEVFGFSGASMGCHAEYKCVPQDGAMALKPPGLSFEQAAALSFGGTTALQFLTRGKIRAGDRVLINGASGAVGSAAVQLAKHFGAHVTGVCSTTNVELVKSLGADAVIDYTREDFTTRDDTYDLIMDTVGTAPFARSGNRLKQEGRLLLVLGDLPAMLHAPWVAMTSKRRVIAGPASERAEDLRLLAELAETGHFKPVIDRCYAFEQIADAHRLVDSGHKKGNVAITLHAAHRPAG
jgi:NADPH:quinone reductase-like Zn-dependent oxidoreductase